MKYAIVESGGKQYRAVEGGTIEVDRLPVKTGENIKLEQILLFADGDNVTVGTPLIKDVPVWTTVLEHFKGEKVTIFNYSPKKRIRVKTGHRQNYTRLSVEQIGGSEFVKKESAKKEKKAVEMEVPVESLKVKSESARKPAAPKAEKASATKAPAKKTASAPAKKTTAAPAKKAPATKPATTKKTTTKTAPKKPATKKTAEKK